MIRLQNIFIVKFYITTETVCVKHVCNTIQTLKEAEAEWSVISRDLDLWSRPILKKNYNLKYTLHLQD